MLGHTYRRNSKDFFKLYDNEEVQVTLERYKQAEKNIPGGILRKLHRKDKTHFVQIIEILTAGKLITDKIKEVIKDMVDDPIFIELFYICGLQFFFIFEKKPLVYVYMLAILMNKFRFHMQSYESDSTINLFSDAISLYEKVILNMVDSIPADSTYWLSINHTTDFNTLENLNEQKLYLIRYSNIRFCQIIFFWRSEYIESHEYQINDDVMKAIWSDYKGIKKSMIPSTDSESIANYKPPYESRHKACLG